MHIFVEMKTKDFEAIYSYRMYSRRCGPHVYIYELGRKYQQSHPIGELFPTLAIRVWFSIMCDHIASIYRTCECCLCVCVCKLYINKLSTYIE